MLMDFSTINFARIEKKNHYLVILLFVRGRGDVQQSTSLTQNSVFFLFLEPINLTDHPN